MTLSLKEALKAGKLKQFIKDHLKQKGDAEQFDAVISSMVGKSKEAPRTSKKKPRGN